MRKRETTAVTFCIQRRDGKQDVAGGGIYRLVRR